MLSLERSWLQMDPTEGTVWSEAVLRCAGLQLQAWLQGSTNDGLRRQLIQLFAVHRREVVKDLEHDQQGALRQITQWLRDNSNSLIIGCL